jgi:serine/threonine protein kinase
VMDFGVARLAAGSSGLTEVGMLIGTPSYMAPEQLMGDSFDHRIDIYAVGVVLFECLTGRLPFEASSTVALIGKLIRETAPKASSLNPEISVRLDAVLERLLSKDPDQRPATARDLTRLLSELS